MNSIDLEFILVLLIIISFILILISKKKKFREKKQFLEMDFFSSKIILPILIIVLFLRSF